MHVLRKIAGHGSLATTQWYLHPDERSITEACDVLTAHLSIRRSPNGPQLRARLGRHVLSGLNDKRPAYLGVVP